MKKLIIFTRYPTPAKTKTRLIPAVGPERAADIQREMTERTVNAADRLKTLIPSVHVEVWFSDGSMADMQKWLGIERSYVKQPEGDLGERMEEAFRSSFTAGFSQTVTIGIDCPDLSEHIMASAFSELSTAPLVLGPSSDGGYYLIGQSYHNPDLFKDIPWGTETVLSETLTCAASSGTPVAMLCELSDIDTPEDLPLLEKDPLDDKITVIIPALNEEADIAKTIESAQSDNVHEIIVVDGGSNDATPTIARNCDATVIECRGGRASQMNEGARAAKTGILLFLHADTILPDSFDDDIVSTLNTGAVCGAFNLGIDAPSRAFRVLEILVSFRSQVLQLPYGDQALFTRKGTFHAIDGFHNMRIMEDYDFVRRARKRGEIVITDSAVKTSPRRWEKLGILRTTMINQYMIAAYKWGVSPDRLAEIYSRKRGATS
jgi:rSAM/selenodomain-associated transferase 2/rSAM/selenodomain-associated transferase 1